MKRMVYIFFIFMCSKKFAAEKWEIFAAEKYFRYRLNVSTM